MSEINSQFRVYGDLDLNIWRNVSSSKGCLLCSIYGTPITSLHRVAAPSILKHRLVDLLSLET